MAPTVKDMEDSVGVDSRGDIAESLRQSYEKSTKSKKKRKDKSEMELLEELKKGDSLRKDNDEIAEANLMRDKNEKDKDEKGIVNRAFSPDSKEKDPKEDIEMQPTRDDVDAPKKQKKKKKKPPPPADDAESTVKETDVDKEALLSTEEVNDTQTKQKKKKKKKHAKNLSGDELDGETELRSSHDSPPPRAPAAPQDDRRLLGITLHRTDRLKQDTYIAAPLVRVHLIDINTQQHVKKEDMKRQPLLPHDSDFFASEVHLPVSTQEFDYKKRQCLIPMWEEQLLIDERYLYFLENDPQRSPDVVVFFEILNNVTINSSKGRTDSGGGGQRWLRVAWAFLKLQGANKVLNVEKKVRLQLYYPHSRFTTADSPASALEDGRLLFDWFAGLPKVKYPATIYVTVKGTRVSGGMPAATGKHIGPLMGPLGSGGAPGAGEDGDEESVAPIWTRLPGQICKVPNKLSLSLKAGKNGCSVLRFSNDGRKLACACADKAGGFPIRVYDIPSGRSAGHFPGHFGLVYDLAWAKSDMELLSCSQDGTAYAWDVDGMGKAPTKMYTHPAYVYTVRYHPSASFVLVTGCFDQVIRVWTSLTPGSTHGKQLKELHGHNGYVNSICFNADGSYMYSCDSVGTVVTWRCSVSSNPEHQGNNDCWEKERIFTDQEMAGIPISMVQLHGSGRRLLMQCLDNTVRVLDLRLNVIMARYIGAVNFKDHLRSTFSPCGTYIFTSSEDGTVIVWSTDTCEKVSSYTKLGYTSPITDICYHPFEHMVCFCAIGQNQPIAVYAYDHHVAETRRQLDEDAGYTTGGVSEDDYLSPSPRTTPRRARSKSPISRLMMGTHQSGMSGGGGGGSTSHHHPPGTDLMTRSTREIASDIIQSVRVDQVARQLNDSTILGGSMRPGGSLRGPRSRRLASLQNSAAGDLSARSREDELEMSTASWGSTFTRRAAAAGTADLVSRLDSEMPGTRMTMLVHGGHQPRFMVSAKTGLSQWVRAVADYEGQRSDELSFVQGDLLKVIMKDNDNWWLAELPDSRRQGYIPTNHVEQVSDTDAQAMLLQKKEDEKQEEYLKADEDTKESSEPSIPDQTESSAKAGSSRPPRKGKSRKKAPADEPSEATADLIEDL